MKFFLDLEFSEIPQSATIIPLSVGVTTEHGDSFYQTLYADMAMVARNSWVVENVLPNLSLSPAQIKENCVRNTGCNTGCSAGHFRQLLTHFIDEQVNKDREIRGLADTPKIEFYGYYASYDWVVLCQLFGTMMHLPKGWPMFIHDLKAIQEMFLPDFKFREVVGHNALLDACGLRDDWFLMERQLRIEDKL